MLHFLVLGAHPDDPDSVAGGLALKMRKKGHKVTFLSLTNGNAGHHRMSKEALRERRLHEMENVAKVYDIAYDTFDLDDGYLIPNIEVRDRLIRYIRIQKPDVIITCRSCDYHPDHRAVGQLVCDCSYLVGVPLICPDTPILPNHPVILYNEDEFTLPVPFRADIAVPIDDEIEKKIQGLLEHESQYYEWLAFDGHWDAVLAAKTKEEATALLTEQEKRRFAQPVLRFQDKFARDVTYGEVFQIDEYGGKMTEEILREMTE